MKSDEPPQESTHAGSRRDVRDLRRSLKINLTGYALKLGHPALFFVVAALYGATTLGVFASIEALLLFANRVAVFGLDKALLWWTPRRPPGQERDGIGSALVLSGLTSAVIAIVLGIVGVGLIDRFFANDQWNELSARDAELALKWMSLSLVPMTLIDVLVFASVARRRVEAQTVVKEGLVPLVSAVLALLLYWIGFVRTGLGIAFFASQVFGLVVAAWLFAKAYRGTRWTGSVLRPPAELLEYSAPIWLSEIFQSLILRLDIFILASLTDPATVGVYQVVMKIGNAMRTIRRSFDPIVTAIISQIGAARDVHRLRASFSYATNLVIVTQMPVYAALFCFTAWILPLIGEEFARGADAVLILCAFWVLNGIIGLNGLIVRGYGRAWLVLFNAAIVAVFEACLLWLIIPHWGLEGAAFVVGLAYTSQNVLEAIEARAIVGAWPYSVSVAAALLVGLAATVAMAGAWQALAGFGDIFARVGAFTTFCVVGALGLLWLRRSSGRFRLDSRRQGS